MEIEKDIDPELWMNKPHSATLLREKIAYKIADMKELYIKSRLRYPFYIMPFARIAAKFIFVVEKRPTHFIGVGIEKKISIDINVIGNPRYPKWVSKIFIREDD